MFNRKFKCHKVVSAMLVGKIEGLVIFSHDESERITVEPEFMVQHDLNQGCYVVGYEDGYISVSPKKAFENGYSEISAEKPSELPKKVTMEHLESIVAKESYTYDDTLTLCVITTTNGFKVIGESACADPSIYNKADGEKYAKQDAISKLWPLEGYLLKQRIFEENK